MKFVSSFLKYIEAVYLELSLLGLYMNEFQALVPNQLREIDFYGDVLIVALINDEAYVALKPIVSFLGLEWSSQHHRLMRDNVLSRHTSNIVMSGGDNKQRKMTCLQLEYFPGWLFGIVPSRVKPCFASKLRLYREDCFKVLWHSFNINKHIPVQSLENNLPLPLEKTPTTEDVLYTPYKQILERVYAQHIRAEQLGLPATLTVEQWLRVLDHFEGKCAYCQERPGVIIEHFIPLCLGGGTTMKNCVPSCYPCNSKKGNYHPDKVTKISREALNIVQSWLKDSTSLGF